jgi:transcriptional regulator with XRE-family HTH domain
MTRDAEYYRELGRRIQRARLKLGLTQEGLASLVGLSRTSMVNIERGRQKVLAHTLVKLSRSLKVEIKELARDSLDNSKLEELLGDLSEPTQQFVRSAMSPIRKKE